METFPFTAREVARQMGGEASGNTALVPGPGHSRKDRSLAVTIDRGAPGGFVVHSHAGDDPIVCKDYVREMMGVEAWRPADGAEPTDNPLARIEARAREKARAESEAADEADRQRRVDYARRIWSEAGPAIDTLVMPYLDSRGLVLPNEVVRGDHLRFHPACPFKGSSGSGFRLPAMVCAMTVPATGELMAVHRTALRADGSGKADHPDLPGSKMMLGAAKGTVVRLSPDDAVTTALGLAEGIENGIAAICAGAYPVWAATSADNMKNFPVLPGIETLALYADTGEAGESAARECGRRWAVAGREVVARFPAAGDWNEIITRPAA